MPDPTKQNLPPGKVKVIIARHTEGHANHHENREYYPSPHVFAFPGKKKFAFRHVTYEYLQRLHFYLQSKYYWPKNTKVDLLYQFFQVLEHVNFYRYPQGNA